MMRILPRVQLPTSKAARRLWRKSKGHIKLRRIYYSCEFVLFAAIYFLVFSGSRLRTIDAYGSRMDLLVSLGLVGLFIVIHVVARRSLLPRIESHYAPAPYDERMDLLVSLGLVGLFIVIHVVARRSLLPRIESHYAPAPYDERMDLLVSLGL